jgi:hypothetical protein
VLGAVATILTLGGIAYQVIQEPSVHPNVGQVDDPFALRFRIYNSSYLFSADDVRLTCVLNHVADSNGIAFEEIQLMPDGVYRSLGRNKSMQYGCPFYGSISNDRPIIEAEVSVSVKFKTLGFERHTVSEHFYWSKRSRAWTEGELVD